MLTRSQILDVLTQPGSVAEQIVELIQQANEHGGQDNITVVLAQYPVLADTPAPTPPPSVITADKPLPVPTPVAALASGPQPDRDRMRGILLILVLILLVGVLWWQYEPAVPADLPRSAPADSSANRNGITQTDSILTP